MMHSKAQLADILKLIDFGSSVAETDQLLESARVETSVYTELLNDTVDLIPGTKGSGKSALYRIFVDFLPDHLLELRKVVVAHGIQQHGNEIFDAYNDSFIQMSESEFVDFWCIYLISLANEQFIKGPRYSEHLQSCSHEIDAFHRACRAAMIPEFNTPKPLDDVLGWVLAVLNKCRPKPKLTFRPSNGSGEYGVTLWGEQEAQQDKKKTENDKARLPQYAHVIKDSLENVLKKAKLNLWLMVDRLDEIFPRRSPLETCALRGLLRTLRIFESKEIRVKVFLRDDILNQIVSGGKGFTALTHVTSRKADTLCWSEGQILTMIVRRLYAKEKVRNFLDIDSERLVASPEYQENAFYKVFPSTVAHGPKQSNTLRWIYHHTTDGAGVVTPRDVIELLTRAKQRQQDDFSMDPYSKSDFIIGPSAIKYGLAEMSKGKRTTFLQAEFPHLFKHIQKFIGGKTQYSEVALRRILGRDWESIVDDLVSIGLVKKEISPDGQTNIKFPFLYREGLELTQGRA